MAGAKFFHVEAFTLFSCKQALSAGFSNITGAKIARRPSKKNDEIGIKVPKNKKKIIERVFVGRRQVGGSSSQLTITSYCTDGQLQKKKTAKLCDCTRCFYLRQSKSIKNYFLTKYLSSQPRIYILPLNNYIGLFCFLNKTL